MPITMSVVLGESYAENEIVCTGVASPTWLDGCFEMTSEKFTSVGNGDAEFVRGVRGKK